MSNTFKVDTWQRRTAINNKLSQESAKSTKSEKKRGIIITKMCNITKMCLKVV